GRHGSFGPRSRRRRPERPPPAFPTARGAGSANPMPHAQRAMPLKVLFCALALLLSGCDAWHATPRDLTVVGWGGTSQDAHREAYWRSFTQQTGIKLREDAWNGGIDLLRAKVHGGHSDWDVVQVEVEELLLGCRERLFEPLDWSALGGRDAFIPGAVNDCGVGAMVWSEVFAYDGGRLKTTPLNWADFWDIKRFPGRRGMRKTP